MKTRNASIFSHLIRALLMSALSVTLALAASPAKAAAQFKLVCDYLIVTSVTVNGAGPYEFLLDTGTSTTLLTTEFAQQLGLRPLDRIELITVIGSETVIRSRLSSLSLASARADEPEVLITELRAIRALHPGICGVIGQNFLSRFNYLLSYRDRRIEFELNDGPVSDLCGERLPFELAENRLLIKAQSAVGERQFRLLLDSAAPGLILFTPVAPPDLVLNAQQMVTLGTDHGSTTAQQSRLRRLRLGSTVFADLPVTMTSLQSGAERIEDGLLPTVLFDSIYINHRQHFVILNPRRNFFSVR